MKKSEKISKKRINTVFALGAFLSIASGALATYFSIDYYGTILAALVFLVISVTGVLCFYAFRSVMNIQRLMLEKLDLQSVYEEESYDEAYDIRKHYR